MDPICHTLVGAALAQTGLGRRTAYGTATLIIAANLPDVDAITMGMGGDLSLCVRRGWTHGILAQALLPLLLAGAVVLYHRLLGRKRPPPVPGQLVLLAYIGLLSHPLLDWLNNYGVRLLMPFDGRWFYGDALYIVDAWMWLLLATAVFLGYSRSWPALGGWLILAAATSTLVFGAAPPDLWLVKAIWSAWLLALILLRWRRIGQREPARSRIALAALAAVCLYIGGSLAATRYGRALVRRELAAKGIVVERLMVGPVAATPFVRDVVAETPEGYRYGTLRLSASGARFDLDPRTIPKPGPIVRRALHAPAAKCFAQWVRFPAGEVEVTGASYAVFLFDVRYARRPAAGFGSAFVEAPKQ